MTAVKNRDLTALTPELREYFLRAVSAPPPAADQLGEALAVSKAFLAAAAARAGAFQAMRDAETDEALARDFYDPLADAIALRLARFTAGRRAPVHAWALLGALYFYAVKFLVWDKAAVPPGAAVAAASLCAKGISRRPFPWWGPAATGPSHAVPAPGDTRGRMLAAAEESFGRSGYNATLVSDIARKAGVSAGNFYLFFGSKQKALETVVTRLRDSLVKKAAAYSAGAGSRVETEAMSFWALFDFIQEHPHGYRIMREAETADRELADAYYGEIFRNYAGQLSRAGEEEFTIKDHELLALALMGAGHMLGMKRVLRGGLRGITDNELLKAVFEGVRE
ncbi:MAG: TetR/AcrR family transcriptional regulator [Elusimicrobia bacterium]|nr:TetR/AcrR family transcriptional regulator [Elusimicrobiota bacterium]